MNEKVSSVYIGLVSAFFVLVLIALYEDKDEKELLISALQESMPIYAISVLANPDLDDSQIESLRILYVPLITHFSVNGDINLFFKANSIKKLIIFGDLRADKTNR